MYQIYSSIRSYLRNPSQFESKDMVGEGTPGPKTQSFKAIGAGASFHEAVIDFRVMHLRMVEQKVPFGTRPCLATLPFSGKDHTILAVETHGANQRTGTFRDHVFTVIHFRISHDIAEIVFPGRLKILCTCWTALSALAAIQVKATISACQSHCAVVTSGAAHFDGATMSCLTMFHLPNTNTAKSLHTLLCMWWLEYMTIKWWCCNKFCQSQPAPWWNSSCLAPPERR